MKYGILGAGPSGLSMAMFVRQPSEVLEQNDSPGGHAGSFFDKGFTFDEGPHIMFSKNQNVLDFMISSLGKNVHRSKRNNKIYFKGKLIKYPFENDLKSLPLEDNFECLRSYVFNPYKTQYAKPKNLREWLLHHFGKGICEKYLFPYNEKVWKIPVEDLSMIWAGRIPLPPAEDIIKSSIGLETEGYLHQLYYHYPLRGGYKAISDAWAKRVNVTYNFKVEKVEKTKRGTFIVSSEKQKREYDQLISTIPIHEFIKLVTFPIPSRVLRAVSGLIVNPMYAISLGIKGSDRNKYTAMYFPESDFLVNRISFPKTFSPHNAPAGNYSIQAEIICRAQSQEWKLSNRSILEHVKEGLVKRNIIRKKSDIVYENVQRMFYSYVVYDRDYEKNTKLIREWFPKHGIHLAGRFSYFEYLNVDGIVAQSLAIASKLNGKRVKLVGKRILK